MCFPAYESSSAAWDHPNILLSRPSLPASSPRSRVSNVNEEQYKDGDSPRLLPPPSYGHTYGLRAQYPPQAPASAPLPHGKLVRPMKKVVDPKFFPKVEEDGKELHMFLWSSTAKSANPHILVRPCSGTMAILSANAPILASSHSLTPANQPLALSYALSEVTDPVGLKPADVYVLPVAQDTSEDQQEAIICEFLLSLQNPIIPVDERYIFGAPHNQAWLLQALDDEYTQAPRQKITLPGDMHGAPFLAKDAEAMPALKLLDDDNAQAHKGILPTFVAQAHNGEDEDNVEDYGQLSEERNSRQCDRQSDDLQIENVAVIRVPQTSPVISEDQALEAVHKKRAPELQTVTLDINVLPTTQHEEMNDYRPSSPHRPSSGQALDGSVTEQQRSPLSFSSGFREKERQTPPNARSGGQGDDRRKHRDSSQKRLPKSTRFYDRSSRSRSRSLSGCSSRSRSPVRRYGQSRRSRSRGPAQRSYYERLPPSNERSRHHPLGRRLWSPPPNRETGIGRPGNNLFVAGFSSATDERELERKFSIYGRVSDVRIVRDRWSGNSRGFGFLSLETDEDADAAIEALDQTNWNGRIILVEKAKSMNP